MRKIIIISSIVISITLFGYLLLGPNSKASDNNTYPKKYPEAAPVSSGSVINDGSNKGDDSYNSTPSEYNINNNNLKDNNTMSDGYVNYMDLLPIEEVGPWDLGQAPDLDPISITVLVNKEHALPKNYVPANLVMPNILFDIPGMDDRKLMRPEAAKALEYLCAAAKQDGYSIYGVSGYRSYARQKKIFLDNIVKKGKYHTLQYSAVPGTSEHQTGLSMDLSIESLQLKLITSFSETSEGIWLSNNAHHYGFIIRYPKDKTNITGYAYEPWHVRYVGRGLATYLYNNKLTLEEYYNYKPSPGFNFEALYADLINYVPPVVTPADKLDEEELENEDNLDDTEELNPEETIIKDNTANKTVIDKKEDKKTDKKTDNKADNKADNKTNTPITEAPLPTVIPPITEQPEVVDGEELENDLPTDYLDEQEQIN